MRARSRDDRQVCRGPNEIDRGQGRRSSAFLISGVLLDGSGVVVTIKSCVSHREEPEGDRSSIRDRAAPMTLLRPYSDVVQDQVMTGERRRDVVRES